MFACLAAVLLLSVPAPAMQLFVKDTQGMGVARKDAGGSMGTDWTGLHIAGDLDLAVTNTQPFVFKR